MFLGLVIPIIPTSFIFQNNGQLFLTEVVMEGMPCLVKSVWPYVLHLVWPVTTNGWLNTC